MGVAAAGGSTAAKFMSVRSFFDSNILVYTDDQEAAPKQAAALALWREHRLAGQAAISVQVLQEYYWVATRKLSVDSAIAIEKLMLFQRADVIRPDADDVVCAARLGVEQQIPFWDAMIVHAALQAHCAVLFSEDFQAGRKYAGLEVVNPFTR